MKAQPVRVVLVDRAFDRIRFHQADRSERQRDAVLKHSTLKKIQLQAAAAEIEDQPRLHQISHRPHHRRANQPRFLLAADHFEFDAGLSPDALHQRAIVARFACRRCGHGAIGASRGDGPFAREIPGRRASRGKSCSGRAAGA